MFQSSGHVPEDSYFKYLEAAGASFVNGSTISTHELSRGHPFEPARAWRSGWRATGWASCSHRLTASSFANQQDVVRNERRQSVENAPYGLVEEELYHQLFPKTHPYYASVIGSHEDIQNAKVNDIREFFKRYYVPNNASLVIAGDIDKVQAKALVTKYFATIPRGDGGASRPSRSSRLRSPRSAAPRSPTRWSCRGVPGWLSVPDLQRATPSGIADLLGAARRAVLYKSLVYTRIVAKYFVTSAFACTLSMFAAITSEALFGT